MKNILFLFLLVICVSCLFDRKPKDIDSFYTTRAFGDMPLIPLLNPIKLSTPKIKRGNIWWVDYPSNFKQHMTIDSILNIGIKYPYIYGNIPKQQRNSKGYIKDREYTSKGYIFIDVFDYVHHPKFIDKIDVRKLSIDSIKKVIIFPERWFVINVADSTTEAFFSKSKYENYLKKKKISGRMYNIDSINKVYRKTGILPWFPDSVKTKLQK